MSNVPWPKEMNACFWAHSGWLQNFLQWRMLTISISFMVIMRLQKQLSKAQSRCPEIVTVVFIYNSNNIWNKLLFTLVRSEIWRSGQRRNLAWVVQWLCKQWNTRCPTLMFFFSLSWSACPGTADPTVHFPSLLNPPSSYSNPCPHDQRLSPFSPSASSLLPFLHSATFHYWSNELQSPVDLIY